MRFPRGHLSQLTPKPALLIVRKAAADAHCDHNTKSSLALRFWYFSPLSSRTSAAQSEPWFIQETVDHFADKRSLIPTWTAAALAESSLDYTLQCPLLVVSALINTWHGAGHTWKAYTGTCALPMSCINQVWDNKPKDAEVNNNGRSLSALFLFKWRLKTSCLCLGFSRSSGSQLHGPCLRKRALALHSWWCSMFAKL